MSSVLRATFENTKVLPDVQYAGGPYYVTADGNQQLLFPFTLNNGVLEIVQQNDFSLWNDTPQLASPLLGGGYIRRLGGINLVQSIGPIFQSYITSVNWGSGALSNPKVYQAGLVTKVQQLNTSNLPTYNPTPGQTYSLQPTPPTDNFTLNVTGFGITYAFEKPLVIVADSPSGKQYITFFTSWDH